MTSPRVAARRRRVVARDPQWAFALLPAFPLVVLVLRLWYLSRQDLATMLLLIQYVNPLGMLSALLITLVWAAPAVILVGRALGALLLVSSRDESDAMRSRLTRVALRVPHWVTALAVGLAALTWQMRFLPLLLMLTLMIFGLIVRDRFGRDPRRVRFATVVLPLMAAAAAYTWLLPSIVDAFALGEWVNALLLALPPGLAPLLTGPVPTRFARLVTHWPALVAALLSPFLIGALFLRAPILPTVGVQLTNGDVVRGHEIAVDDVTTTLLELGGSVRFVPNNEVAGKALCPDATDAPASRVDVHGWPVESTALEWVAPVRRVTEVDPRCQGRPLTKGP